MDPLTIGLMVGTSLFGGLANQQAQRRAQEEYEKRKQYATSILEKSIVSDEQLNMMMNNVSRLFNSRLISTLNTTAIRQRGVANQGVIGGAVAGQMESAKIGSQIELEQQILARNTQTRSQIAALQMGGPTADSTSDFLTGALTALPTGIELSKFLLPQDIEDPNQDTNQSSGYQQTGSAMGYQGPDPWKGQGYGQNPFLGKRKIKDDMLYNFIPSASLRRFF